jgi:hypothetical protein
MRKVLSVISAIALAFALSGCAQGASSTEPSQSSVSQPTPDATLIPIAAGDEVKAVDYTLFDVGFDEYLFKAGEGPVWCTINSVENWVLCEMSEPAAEYEPLATPEGCEGSYGYQIKLFADPATEPGFICSGGYYSDASVAQTLSTGEKITVGDITCYVNEITARCDNASGQYIALGPKVWAAKN